MLPDKIIKKIKEVEIKAEKLSSSTLVGKHLSTFRGNGIDFSDLREYRPGDDVRNIAWRQSARCEHTLVKTFIEERNLNIVLMLDISPSGNFGCADKFNAEAAAEFAATIAMSAIKSGDNTGIVLFSDDIELFIPPRKGRSHVLRIIREILFFKPRSEKTNIRDTLKKLQLILPASSQVFLITDIWSDIEHPELSVFARKHDLNVITLYDSLERHLYDMGNVELNDLETGENIIINTSSKKLRIKYEREMNRLFDRRRKFLISNGARHAFINNKSNLFLEIIKFYSAKKRI